MNGVWLTLGSVAVMALAPVVRGSASISAGERIHDGAFEIIDEHEERTGLGIPFDVLHARLKKALRRREIRVSRPILRAVVNQLARTGMIYEDATGWRLN